MKLNKRIIKQVSKLDDKKESGVTLNRKQRRMLEAATGKICNGGITSGTISVTPCNFPAPPAEVCHVL